MITTKLKDNRGVTLIHALVSVLIFAVFSSIIISSTNSNLKSAQTQKDYQQSYLAVSNAVQLFVDSIDGDYFEKVVTTETDLLGNVTTDKDTVKWDYKESLNSDGSTKLKNPMASIDAGNINNIKTLFTNALITQSGVVKTQNLTISTTIKENASGEVTLAENVACDISMNNKGEIVANFYLLGREANSNFYINIEVPVIGDSSTPYKTETTYNPDANTASKQVDTYRIEFDTLNAIVHKGNIE